MPSTKLALATVISVGKAPLPSFAIVTLSLAILAVVTLSSLILAVVTASSRMLAVCSSWFCSSCAANNNCLWLALRSAALTDDPAVYVAFALSTSVSRKIRISAGLVGILPDVKTTLPPPVVV